MILPVNTRALAHWRSPHDSSRSSFRPNGKVFATKGHPALTPNSRWRTAEPVWSARIFVGFSVGQVPTYEMDDLIKVVKRVRKEQVGKSDASFLYQKGIYTHMADGEEVVENGAQVIIINFDPGLTPDQFEDQVADLAEVIRVELQQEAVIAEIQRNGVVKAVIGVDNVQTEEIEEEDE